jgi:Kef-type K+ transport system membrane component KefB
MHEVFSEFAILLLISAAAGAIALRLRQPVLIAYIAVGIIAGPGVLGLVRAHGEVDLLAQVGVAVLLFVVGLKLDIHHIRHLGPVALATGLGQLGFTIVFGFLLTRLLGRPPLEALYIAVALTFSSTIIIVKLLSDKRELDSLHGRIAVGFLIVQDLAVVLAMMVMSAMRGNADDGMAQVFLSLSWRIAAAAAGLFVLMRWVLPPVVAAMARSQELLLVFAVAWGTGLAALGEWAGFSREAGAFLAGFSLASTAYRDAIGARLSGLRDFLLLFFFLDLGNKLDLSALGGEVMPAMVLATFVLIGNPLIVMAIMGYMGYRSRTGFLAGLTVAQISEFSIIFIAMGMTLGHVGGEALGLVTLVGLVTIAMSTYLILYSHPLYEHLAPWLRVFQRASPFRELADTDGSIGTTTQPDVVIFGVGRYGSRLLRGLEAAGFSALGADFDPERTRAMRRDGLSVRFGDVTEPSFLDELPLARTAWVVSALPDLTSNRSLIAALREHGFRGSIAVVAREPEDQAALESLRVDTVLVPVTDAVDRAIDTLRTIMQQEKQRA